MLSRTALPLSKAMSMRFQTGINLSFAINCFQWNTLLTDTHKINISFLSKGYFTSSSAILEYLPEKQTTR